MNPALAQRYPKVVDPHIVTVHNPGAGLGYHYIEMEYVTAGNSLKESLIQDGAMESVRATSLARHVALAPTHRAGLIYRYVKPANMLLTAAPNSPISAWCAALLTRVRAPFWPGRLPSWPRNSSWASRRAPPRTSTPSA